MSYPAFPAIISASLDSLSGKFVLSSQFDPVVRDSTFYLITFSVTDGVITDSKTITITFVDVNYCSVFPIDADSALISRAGGGIVQVKSSGAYTKHRVIIPPNALQNNETIIICSPTTADISLNRLLATPSAVKFKVQGYDEYTFRDSVYITLEYKDFEARKNKQTMRIHKWDKNRNVWKRVMSSQYLNTAENTVTARVKDFSIYGVIEVSDTSFSTNVSKGWNMVSLPVEIAYPNDPISVLRSYISPFIFEQGNSSIYEYDETTGKWILPSSVQYMKGYILYGFTTSSVCIRGLEIAGDFSKTLSYTNNNGWHLLGNPYSMVVDWDNNISRDSGIDNIYYRWNGSYYDNYPYGGLTKDIAPYEGFWVHTTSNSAQLSMRYPGLNKSTVQQTKQSDIDWRIQIIAESGENKDIHNYFGVSSKANTEYDAMDVYELTPLNSEFISLYFPHPEWNKNAGNFTQDIRQKIESDIQWDFSVAVKSSDNFVMLKWMMPENLPNDLNVILRVHSTGEKIDLKKQSQYKYFIQPSLNKSAEGLLLFEPDPSSLSKRLSESNTNIYSFSVILEKQSKTNVPSMYYLNQNYPNPFNPSTTIEYGLLESGEVLLRIYNSLGQEVRSFVKTSQQPGVYKIIWDGKNNEGVSVPSGIYFYEISVNNFNQIRKLLILK